MKDTNERPLPSDVPVEDPFKASATYRLTRIVHHVEYPDPPTTGLWFDRENNVVWFDYPHKHYMLIADSGCDYLNGLDYTPKPPFKPLITAMEIINKQEGSMITSKQINFHGKEYIHYAGTHDELCRMLRVGDLVTMRRHDADNVESVAIVGTVTEICGNVVTVSVAGGESDCITGRQSSKPPFLYAVTAIKRPVENMLPDSPGPWADKDDDTWIVDNDLNAIRVSCDGEWWIGGGIILPSEYAGHAPFKKINIEIIKEK